MKALVLLLLPGCSSLLGVHDFTAVAADAVDDDAAPPDAAPPPDAPANAVCIGSPHGLGPFCVAAMPMPSFLFSGGTFSTQTCTGGSIITLPAGGTACAVVATSVTFMGSAIVTGPRPLVVLATDTIHIAGTIDASSHSTGPGPGAATTACTAPSGTAGTANEGSGGGGGGGFGTAGGAGGKGHIATGGGSGPALQLPTTVRGGCAGGSGGDETAPAPTGGLGGGAIYFAAAVKIAMSGEIAANGAGGMGGVMMTDAGGGGGGSGGLIGLDAPTITTTGAPTLVANGGGGGAGAGQTQNGNPGSDPSGLTGGAGGPPTAGNGQGGNGANGTEDGLVGGDSNGPGNDGGGGGGGGLGEIIVYSTTSMLSAQTSPPITFKAY